MWRKGRQERPTRFKRPKRRRLGPRGQKPDALSTKTVAAMLVGPQPLPKESSNTNFINYRALLLHLPQPLQPISTLAFRIRLVFKYRGRITTGLTFPILVLKPVPWRRRPRRVRYSRPSSNTTVTATGVITAITDVLQRMRLYRTLPLLLLLFLLL